MEKAISEMAAKSFVIPENFLKEFKGDMRVIIGGHTQGIWMPPEVLERNADLVRKFSKNFEAVLVPKEFF